MLLPDAVHRLNRRIPLLRSTSLPNIAFALYLAAIALFAYSRPYYNWDLAGYLGAALRLEGKDTIAVHDQTYATLKSEVPEAAYRELSSPADPYKSLMAEDAVQFARQIHLYSIRPLYTSLLALMHLLGAPIVRVTVLVSIFSVIGTGIVVRSWLGRHLSAWGACISAILLLSGARIPDLARYSTPDGAACFVFMSGIYLLVQGRFPIAGYFVLWLSILVRTDYAVPFLVFVAFMRYGAVAGATLPQRRFAILIIACLAAVALIHMFSGNIIWEGMPYGRGFVVTIRQLFLNDLFIVLPCFIGLNIATLVAGRKHPDISHTAVQISLIAIVSLAARMILFPHLADRFYPVEYLLTGIAFAAVYFGNEALNNSRPPVIARGASVGL
jgi:hypothetical protein